MASGETATLERYIEASVERLLSGQYSSQNGLILLGSWQEAMPALVHLDPVLEPVDSRVFAVLWIWARQEGRSGTAFPTYDTLLQRCNIQSRRTVARSLAILRITRWVTLCRRVRDPAGRHRGNIYALHDEPLVLPSTLHLDPRYMDFLDTAKTHNHPYVREVARGMWTSLEGRIAEGEDVVSTSPISQTDQRIEAHETHLLTGVNMKKYVYITLRIITAFVVVLLRVILVPLRAIASGAKYVRTVDECQQHYRPPRIPLDD